MSGVVRVTTTGPTSASVNILDGPGRFDQADVTIRVGEWSHGRTPGRNRTLSPRPAARPGSFAFNGRVFVGNTPTIVARTGKRIRWYVFNLDLSAGWHNFHVHGQRWAVGHRNC